MSENTKISKMEDSDSSFKLDSKHDVNQADLIDKENEELIKQVNVHLKTKALIFNGYRDSEGNDIIDAEGSDGNDHAPIEIKKELVKSIIEGDLFKLDDLLRLSDVNINTRFYSENLLMIAIKNNQENIAEYLIANGVDLDYEAKSYEFGNERYKSPFNCFKYTCRQLAYNKNMLKIVDLIDIFDKKTDRKIRNVLAKRYLKENYLNIEKKQLKNDSISIFSELDNHLENFSINTKELTEYLLSNEANYLQMRYQNQKEIEESKITTSLKTCDSEQEVNEKTITESSLSYLSNDTQSKDGYLVPRKHRKFDNIKNLVINIIEENKNKKTLFETENSHFKKKCLEYRGYKINLFIQHDQFETNELETKKFNSQKKPFKISNNSDLYIKKILNCTSITNQYKDHRLTKNNKSSSNISSDKIRTKFSDIPLIIPRSVTSYGSNNYYFENLNPKNRVLKLKIQKELSKINNHNYLIELMKKRPSTGEIINKNLTRYNEGIFPIQNFFIKNNENGQLKIDDKSCENRNKCVNFIKNKQNNSDNICKNISFKIGLNEDSILNEFSSKLSLRMSPKIGLNENQHKPKNTYKTNNQIFNSYLTSLKKSGLINKNCLPIINDKPTLIK